MTQENERFLKQKPRKKAAPGKRVSLSEDAKRAYEEMIQKRDERERDYARHLAQDNKPR